MWLSRLLLLATLMGVIGITPLIASTGEPAVAKRPAFARLVAKLARPDYEVRQKATQQLIYAGGPAVESLAEAAMTSSLEAAVRAVAILEQIYLADDDETVDLSEKTLEQLVQSAKPGISLRADSVLAEHYYDVRQPRAAAAIQRMGGHVEYSGTSRNSRVLSQRFPNSQYIAYILLDKSTWKGGRAGLEQLKRLSRLELLINAAQALSDAEIEELLAALPNLKNVQKRGAARLGVQADSRRNDICQIAAVQPGLAADKAGIQPGDVIKSLDSRPVQNFQELVDVIKLRKPGDKVQVELVRNQEPVTVTVVLQGWVPPKQPRRPEIAVPVESGE